MKTSNQLKAGALLSYVNLAISTVIPLLYTPVMLRLLGQAEYGLYSLSNSIISYLSLLTLGLGSTIHRYYMKSLTANDKVMLERTAGLFVVIYSIIAFVSIMIGLILTCFTGTFFAQGLAIEEISKLNILIVILAMSASISLLFVPYASVTVCYERYIFQKVLAIAGTIAAPLLNLAVLYAGFASIGMATVSLVAQVITLAVNVWYCTCKLHVHPRFRNLPLELLKDIFGFTIFVFIGMIADLLYWATDKVLIGALIGTTAVAVYNIGATFNSILQQLSTAISSVFGPRVNQLVFSGNPISQISELLIRVARIQYLIISLVVSGFIVFGQVFIQLWAGEGYEEAYYIALLTMIPLTIPLLQNIAFNTIVAQNKHQFRSILYVILALANVISTYLLLPVMGIIGAALCTFVVFIIGQGIIMNWFYYKRIGLDIPYFWRNILRMTIVPALMICVSFLVQQIGISITSLPAFAVSILLYTGMFCALSWFFSMNRYEKNLLSSLIKRVLPKLRKAH